MLLRKLGKRDMEKQSDVQALINRTKKLLSNQRLILESAAEISPEVTTSMKPWAIMKLLFLDSYASEYVPLIKKYYKNFFYVDLFAGSGIGKIQEENYKVLGSPLLMASRHLYYTKANKRGFKKLLLIERDPSAAEVLNKRIQKVGLKNDEFEVYNQDCNYIIDNLTIQLKQGHSLIFIDPYGSELKWQTLEKLLNLNADLIINFQTPSMARIPQAGKLGPLAKMFPENLLKEVNAAVDDPSIGKGERLLDLYRNAIGETKAYHSPGAKVLTVRIRKDNMFYYDLLLAVKATKKGNPWLKPLVDLASKIKEQDIRSIIQIFRVASGHQNTLNGF